HIIDDNKRTSKGGFGDIIFKLLIQLEIPDAAFARGSTDRARDAVSLLARKRTFRPFASELRKKRQVQSVCCDCVLRRHQRVGVNRDPEMKIKFADNFAA